MKEVSILEQLMPTLAEQGILVMSFVWLLKYTLDTSKEREARLMEFMNGMKDELKNISNAVTKLGDDVDELKNELRSK